MKACVATMRTADVNRTNAKAKQQDYVAKDALGYELGKGLSMGTLSKRVGGNSNPRQLTMARDA